MTSRERSWCARMLSATAPATLGRNASELFEVGPDGTLRRVMPRQRLAMTVAAMPRRAEKPGIYQQLAALRRLEDSVEEREHAVRQREEAVRLREHAAFERERAVRELERALRGNGGAPWPSETPPQNGDAANGHAGGPKPALVVKHDHGEPIGLLLEHVTAAKAALGPLLMAKDNREAQLEALKAEKREAEKARPEEEKQYSAERTEYMMERRQKQVDKLTEELERAKARLLKLRAAAAEQVGVHVADFTRRYESAIEDKRNEVGRVAFTECARRLMNVGELEEGQLVRVPIYRADEGQDAGGGGARADKIVEARVERHAGGSCWELAIYDLKEDAVAGTLEGGFRKTKRFPRHLIYAEQRPSQTPDGIAGRIDDIDGLCRLYRDAAIANETLRRMGARVEESVRRGVKAKHAPLKATARLMEKVAEKYDGDFAQVCDIARMTFECDDFDAATRTLKAVHADREIEVVLCKDRLRAEFNARETGGYRDALLNARELRTGHIVEVQITLSSLLEIKTRGGHAQYKLVRALELNDAATYTHEGKLTDEVVKHVRCGLIRRLVVRGGSACTSSMRSSMRLPRPRASYSSSTWRARPFRRAGGGSATCSPKR